MEMRLLPEDPHLVRTIAQWHYAEWGHLSGTLPEREANLWAQAGRDAIPLTVVALEEREPIGSASLLPDDMPQRPELGPWLASVYVLPQQRGRGIGKALCRQAMAEAARLAVPTLYLFTDHSTGFYEALGWEPLEQATHRGEAVTLMHWRAEATGP